ncbi:uncharacterized protein LOC132743655 [Ruditapes philippinarum]|uniref:uncharacterized protein LOC132743655 n=1 Tax=Ruditapes philippinarum TaxID=129788 RepID=UPI00295AC291|nr:uncharacterized protein LOC132743655 [Ruditapes philippinarum]
MYHSSTDADTKRWIMEDFTKCDSTIKVLVCTVAFGMGVSISDTEIVIHWGAPKSILAYWQEIGRSGRSGQYSYAIMYPYKHSLISNMATEEIKTLSKSSECLRKYALTKLVTKKMKGELPSSENCVTNNCQICACAACSCCSFCYKLCQCKGKLDAWSKLLL